MPGQRLGQQKCRRSYFEDSARGSIGIVKQEGNGPLDQRATRAMKIGATFLILLNSVTTSDYHCTPILGFLQNFQHPAA